MSAEGEPSFGDHLAFRLKRNIDLSSASAPACCRYTGGVTGKKLGDYFVAGRSDPKGTRRTINRMDSDALIVGYHAQFRVVLMASVKTRDKAPPGSHPGNELDRLQR